MNREVAEERRGEAGHLYLGSCRGKGPDRFFSETQQASASRRGLVLLTVRSGEHVGNGRFIKELAISTKKRYSRY